jgi:predicted O-methyltransferase YrrM
MSGSAPDEKVRRVRRVRERLAADGPRRTRPFDADFQKVALPAGDAEILRDAIAASGAHVVIEIGLAYGSSALAIGEALCAGGAKTLHVIIDPFQHSAFANVGWEVLQDAGLEESSTLITEPSSLALARLAGEGFQADAAFVDGSHRFHEVFVDFYHLRKLVRPGGLIILDDAEWPSVRAALRYYDVNLGWQSAAIGGRLTARTLPPDTSEPDFTDFKPFWPM